MILSQIGYFVSITTVESPPNHNLDIVQYSLDTSEQNFFL